MKKQQIAEPIIAVEWNCAAVDDSACDELQLSKSDLLALARALGRMAAKRELARARDQRARSATTSDQIPGKVPAKVLD